MIRSRPPPSGTDAPGSFSARWRPPASSRLSRDQVTRELRGLAGIPESGWNDMVQARLAIPEASFRRETPGIIVFCSEEKGLDAAQRLAVDIQHHRDSQPLTLTSIPAFAIVLSETSNNTYLTLFDRPRRIVVHLLLASLHADSAGAWAQVGEAIGRALEAARQSPSALIFCDGQITLQL